MKLGIKKKRIVKEQLSKDTIKDIQQKVILQKRVEEFIEAAKIPRSAYYTSMLNGKINTIHHQKIVEKLKEF